MFTLSFTDPPTTKRNKKFVKRFRRAHITCENCGWNRKVDILKPGAKGVGMINPWWSMSMLRSAAKHVCPKQEEPNG